MNKIIGMIPLMKKMTAKGKLICNEDEMNNLQINIFGIFLPMKVKKRGSVPF